MSGIRENMSGAPEKSPDIRTILRHTSDMARMTSAPQANTTTTYLIGNSGGNVFIHCSFVEVTRNANAL